MRPLLMTLALLWATPAAHAGDGHDPGDSRPAAHGAGPSRHADGSVFLPKPAQRLLSVRTAVAVESELARTVELSGRVVVDPNAGGRVQSTLAGRLEAGPRGLPSIGQAVRKGEVLAAVVASAAPIERSNQAAQLAELRAARTLAEKRLVRLRELADTVPRREIESAESELASLTARATAVGGGLGAREPLVAPVSGVIAVAHAVSGQVVDARELVYEIVDPSRLQVEALAFEPELAGDIAAASLVAGKETVPLAFVGAAGMLREQALPLVFRARSAALSAVAVGQPVKVFVQTKSRVKGIAVPAASLMKNPANQTIVWVKTGPETFAPRVVITEPLDGVRVAVVSGLKAGDRVATQGATLVNQIR